MKGIALFASLSVLACVTLYSSAFLVLYVFWASGNISDVFPFLVHFTANDLHNWNLLAELSITDLMYRM